MTVPEKIACWESVYEHVPRTRKAAKEQGSKHFWPLRKLLQQGGCGRGHFTRWRTGENKCERCLIYERIAERATEDVIHGRGPRTVSGREPFLAKLLELHGPTSPIYQRWSLYIRKGYEEFSEESRPKLLNDIRQQALQESSPQLSEQKVARTAKLFERY